MRKIVTLCAIGLLGGCIQSKPWQLMVDADVETEAVNHSGDAADDPALWVNFADPEKSLILGTQKKQGLYSYDLSGNIKQFLPAGRLNNVDIRQNYHLRGIKVDVIGASNRSNNSISLFTIDSDGGIHFWDGLKSDQSAFSEVYGFCMGHVKQRLIFVMTGKDGDAELYELDKAFSNDDINIKKLRTLRIPSQSEGCVIDDSNGNIYIGEEDTGVWKFNYWENGIRELVINVDGEKLVADVEGLALIKQKNKTYLMVSSQGNSQYPIYDLEDYHHVISVSVKGNNQIDQVTGTDGIDVNQLLSSSQFPEGLFITQDDKNTRPQTNQNFKVVSLKKILSQLEKTEH
ncbi:MAG: phytase [Marinicella sp.]